MGNVQSEMQHLANQLSLAGPEEKKFLQAVYENKPEQAAALLKTHPNSIYARTDSWYNAWHIAAQSGSLAMLEVLYKHGSSGTRKPLPGEPPQHSGRTKVERETPLMIALAADHMTAVQFLLSIGASPTDQDRYGNTVVHYAALRGQTKVLEMLLASAEGLMAEAGPNNPNPVTNYTELRNEAGLQPLHFAVWGGKQEAAKILLQYKADMVARSSGDSMAQVTCNSGSTPLHVAAQRNDPEMVKFLLDAYVQALNDGRAKRQDPRTMTDNYRSTPWAVAVSLKRDAVAAVLDPNHKYPGLEAALSHAATLANMAPELRRTMTRGRTSNTASSAAAALAAVGGWSNDGSGHGKGPAPASADPFDGFAALAAGASTSSGGAAHGSDGFKRDSVGGAAEKPKLAVPVLAPPPPKAGKAAGAVPILSPPPGAKTVPQPQASSPAAAPKPAGAPAMPPPAPASAATSPATSPPAAARAAQPAATPVPAPAAAPQPDIAPEAPSPAPAPAPTPAAAPAPAVTAAPSAPAPVVAPAAEPKPAETSPPAAPAPAAVQSSSERGSERGASTPAGPPSRFLCPITNNIMVDPVVACDGRTYERDAVEMWIELGNSNFPGSGGAAITTKTLKPNMALRAEIAAWKSKASEQ